MAKMPKIERTSPYAWTANVPALELTGIPIVHQYRYNVAERSYEDSFQTADKQRAGWLEGFTDGGVVAMQRSAEGKTDEERRRSAGGFVGLFRIKLTHKDEFGVRFTVTERVA